jgi:ribosomal protein S18 acetylase RimI-like enzyme
MYQFAPIDKSIDTTTFECEEEQLTSYFRTYARQNHEKRIATCMVCLDRQNRIVGYYTFAMAQVAKQSLPPDLAKGIPGYPMGAIRIGRLARDKSAQGQGVGEVLLRDCLRRIVGLATTTDITGPAFRFILVDAKTEKAAKFYEKYGFVRFKDTTGALVLPLATAVAAFQS